MKYLARFIKNLSDNVEIKKRDCSSSIYFNIDNFKIRLSDHNSPIPTFNINLSIVKSYNSDNFIITYKDTRKPLIFNRKKTNEYIRFCLLNNTLEKEAKSSHEEIKEYKKEIKAEEKAKEASKYDYLSLSLSDKEIELFIQNKDEPFNPLSFKTFTKKFGKFSLSGKMSLNSRKLINMISNKHKLTINDIIGIFYDKDIKRFSDDEYIYNILTKFINKNVIMKQDGLLNYTEYIRDNYKKNDSYNWDEINNVLLNLVSYSPIRNMTRKLISEICTTYRVTAIDVIKMYYNLSYKEKNSIEFMEEYLNNWKKTLNVK